MAGEFLLSYHVVHVHCTLYTCHTILLLNKTITHVMTHQAKQAKPLSCHAKSRKPYHTSEQHTPLLVTFVALGVERHLAPYLDHLCHHQCLFNTLNNASYAAEHK